MTTPLEPPTKPKKPKYIPKHGKHFFSKANWQRELKEDLKLKRASPQVFALSGGDFLYVRDLYKKCLRQVYEDVLAAHAAQGIPHQPDLRAHHAKKAQKLFWEEIKKGPPGSVGTAEETDGVGAY